MTDLDVTLDELRAGISLEAGKHHRIRLIRPVLTRVVGEIFDTNRTFLLPRAASGLLEVSRKLQEAGSGSLVVVSHMDRLDDINLGTLSVERAEIVASFLAKDVDKWVQQFAEDLPEDTRWGSAEQQMMITAMPGFRAKSADETPVAWFQRKHADSLVVDGVLGPKTRRKLVEQYMLLGGEAGSGAPLDFEFVAHGCQAHIPLKLTFGQLTPKPAPGFSGSIDRRIELFLVRGDKGISPPPSSQISDATDTTYPNWLAQSKQASNVFIGPSAPVAVTLIEMPDVLFNHDSALPCLDDNENLLHGLTHAYLHFKANSNQELLVVGHTDTSGEPSINYPLSDLRAAAVLAILQNDEEAWDKVAKERSKVEDYQRIFKTFANLYYWDCDPGEVDNLDGPKTRRAVKGFQHEANSIYDLGIATDGVMGPETWNAIFKIYRALLEAGGVDLDVTFSLGNCGTGTYGCGESFPIDRAEDKDLISQENRRVELYFAHPGTVAPLLPPLNPETPLTERECVLFDRSLCKKAVFGHRSLLSVKNTDLQGAPIAGATARLLDAGGNEVLPPADTDANGMIFWPGLDEGEYAVEFA